MIIRSMIFMAISLGLVAQNTPDLEVIKVRDNIYMLMGRGGNIGLCIGEDGAFLVDDQYAPATEKILAAVKSIADKPIEFVINTHWHGDHTGGNENFGKADSVIFAHENVRKRMSTKQFIEYFQAEVPPSPKEALPVVTFSKDLVFHLNGETIHAIHVKHAHTDGDSVIHFKKANVIHTGDVYFNEMYPFIDGSSGGSIDGFIAAVNKILDMAGDDTLIIPGHGPLSNKKELTQYRDMLVDVHAKVKKLKDSGKSLEETVAAKPSAAYDQKLGESFFKPAAFISFIYETLK